MGSFVGHVAPGFAFFVIGLWHLINHIKLHSRNPNSYTSSLWFPSSRTKYLELYFIITSCSISISMELFIGPDRHQPLDSDGTIPSNHLHNFEHSNISLTFLVYALLSILLDKLAPPAHRGMSYLLAAVAFGQQLLMFHLHSADHMGVEGQYHLLLQIMIFTSLATTLLGISYPESFLVSFVRSTSIVFQGVWLMVMGFMLWTPSLIPKGCFINFEEGHEVVRCHGEEALERAKSLVNIMFSWYVIGVMVFATACYLVVNKSCSGKIEYQSLSKFVIEDDEHDDVEAQKKSNGVKMEVPMQIGSPFGSMDIER